MPRIDCNAFLGAYPWRKVPGTSADALLKALARTKIDAAWVTHLPSLFWRDPTEGNAWLYATTREDGRFKPVPTVHPGLAQWEQVSQSKKSTPKQTAKEQPASAPPAKKKLSWKEAREYEQMEGLVMNAEELLDQKRTQLELPEITSDPARLTAAVKEMDAAQEAVDHLYERWAELESKQA